MCELHTLQEIKINWDEAAPVQEPGEKEKTSMGDMFTNDLLANDSKLWCHQFRVFRNGKELERKRVTQVFLGSLWGRAGQL